MSTTLQMVASGSRIHAVWMSRQKASAVAARVAGSSSTACQWPPEIRTSNETLNTESAGFGGPAAVGVGTTTTTSVVGVGVPVGCGGTGDVPVASTDACAVVDGEATSVTVTAVDGSSVRTGSGVVVGTVVSVGSTVVKTGVTASGSLVEPTVVAVSGGGGDGVVDETAGVGTVDTATVDTAVGMVTGEAVVVAAAVVLLSVVSFPRGACVVAGDSMVVDTAVSLTVVMGGGDVVGICVAGTSAVGVAVAGSSVNVTPSVLPGMTLVAVVSGSVVRGVSIFDGGG
jgi:fibronectin-binding autotransporter adhesin